MKIFLHQIRHLRNQGFTTFVNVIGLTIGFTGLIVIGLFIRNEFSYNYFHARRDNIYRALTFYPETGYRSANVTYRISDDLVKNVSGVISSVRFYNFWGPYLISNDTISYNESNLYYTDSTVVDIFTFKYIWGDSIGALSGPGTALITRSTSSRLFGKENPLGKSILIDKTTNLKITGVVEDFPQNSDWSFSVLVYDPSRLNSWGNWINESWNFTNFNTYVLLSPNYTSGQFDADYQNFITASIDSSARKYVPGLKLQKLSDMHLHSADIHDDYDSQGSIKLVVIFISIAFCILIIALTNYICLSISGITKRSRDAQIRKIHGETNFGIVKMYIYESLTLSVFSFLLAVLIAGILQPYLSKYADFYFNVNELNSLSLMLLSGFMVFIVSSISGIIIARYIIRYRKSENVNQIRTKFLRSFSTSGVYTFFQFFVSTTLVICTVHIFRQLSFVQNTDMGFNPDLVINVPVDKTFQTARQLRDDLLKDSHIGGVTFASSFPPSPYHYGSVSSPDEPSIEGISVKNFIVDFNFIDIMGMKIIHGRNFSRAYSTDLGHGAIINRAMAEKMKWEDPIGKRLKSSMTDHELVVIGVVDNFHFRSFREIIEPALIFLSEKSQLYNMGIRLNDGDLTQGLNYIRNAWEKLNPEFPFEYQFLDQKIADIYNKDKRQSHILLLFSILAIVMACLGLAAISWVYAKHRTKEIGIRKINGAEVRNILLLLNKEFIIWVIASALAGIPVAHFIMQRWLESFAYRITLSWSVFFGGCIVTIAIAILTVSVQSWYAASRNPVEALRYE